MRAWTGLRFDDGETTTIEQSDYQGRRDVALDHQGARCQGNRLLQANIYTHHTTHWGQFVTPENTNQLGLQTSTSVVRQQMEDLSGSRRRSPQ